MHEMVQVYQHSPMELKLGRDQRRYRTTKHTTSMCVMDGRGKGKLCEDVRKHDIGRAPDGVNGDLPDEVAGEMIFNVDVFGQRGGHVVGSKGNEAFLLPSKVVVGPIMGEPIVGRS